MKLTWLGWGRAQRRGMHAVSLNISTFGGGRILHLGCACHETL